MTTSIPCFRYPVVSLQYLDQGTKLCMMWLLPPCPALFHNILLLGHDASAVSVFWPTTSAQGHFHFKVFLFAGPYALAAFIWAPALWPPTQRELSWMSCCTLYLPDLGCLLLFVSALIAVRFNLTCFLQSHLSPWRIPAIRGWYVLFTSKLLTRIDFGTWYILMSISRINKWLKECPGPSELPMNDCILSLEIFKLILWSLEIMGTDMRNLWSWKFKASFERYMIYFVVFIKCV